MAKDEYEVVEGKSNYMHFGKVGDYIQGTLREKLMTPKVDEYGNKRIAIVIKPEKIVSHENKTQEPKEFMEGDEVFVGLKEMMKRKVDELEICQKVRVKFAEEREYKKGMAKIIEIQKAGMDEACLIEMEQQANEDTYES